MRQAHVAARQIYKENAFLQIPSGIQNFGTLYAAATDFGLVRAMDIGRLPWGYRWMPFARPTGHYLEMHLKHLTLSQNTAHDPKAQLRDSVFRENKRLGNQMELFPEKQNDGSMPHFILIHGYRKAGFEINEPEFAHFGYCSKLGKQWEWQSSNLMNMPYAAADSSDTENTEADFEAIQLLKEAIERWKRDNG